MTKSDILTRLLNTSNSNIPSNLIIGSYLDTKGRMWFGSYGSGVFYEQNGTFHSISYPMEKSDENPISYTRHIIEDKEGNLWMGVIYERIILHGFQRKIHGLYPN